ncbi:MAG: L,D-transpeptidase [Thermoleophilaceae bacterium]
MPLAAVLVALALAFAFVAPAAGSGADRGPIQKLDRPGRTSYWAFVDFPTAARAKPALAARRVARLKTKTEDGTDELVQVLARATRKGRVWLQVRLPILPNNSTGWVVADNLSKLRVVHTWLKIDRAHERLKLIRRGRVIFKARIGVGQPQWPTPRGNFYIRDELTGFPPGTIYGVLAFGTSAKSAVLTDWPQGGVIGIHGTNQPELIPGHVSHGCVRMKNRDIRRLAKLLPMGTPVQIR